MNTLQVFENPKFGSIRTVEIDGEPWLVGKDVAAALGYGKGKSLANAIANHVDPEDKGVTELMTPGGMQKVTIINESGLYSLILSSKLPGSKKFKRWVTAEVLPSIRKTGGYSVPSAEDAPASKKHIVDLTAAVQLLTERMDALAAREASFPALPKPLPFDDPPETEKQVPGIAAQRRWMRAVSEKLDLLSSKIHQPHNIILSQVYRILEDKWEADLEDERMKVMVAQSLPDCSMLKAIFYNETLRDGFQKIVDFNLAPENRGW